MKDAIIKDDGYRLLEVWGEGHRSCTKKDCVGVLISGLGGNHMYMHLTESDRIALIEALGGVSA